MQEGLEEKNYDQNILYKFFKANLREREGGRRETMNEQAYVLGSENNLGFKVQLWTRSIFNPYNLSVPFPRVISELCGRMCWDNASPDTIGYQIKSLVAGKGTLLLSCWSIGPQFPPNMTRYGYCSWLSPEFCEKALWLKTPHSGALEHGDVPLILTWWLHSY